MLAGSNILFIVSEYPPVKSPTALAASFVIDEMKKKANVFCLAVNSNDNEKCNDDNVVYLEKKPKKNRGFFNKRVNRVAFRAQQAFLIPVYPILHPILQWKLNRLALKVCKENAIDIVVCVSFPFESVVAGRYIKENCSQKKVVAYLIDAYACGTDPKYLPKRYSLRRRTRYEYKHLQKCDVIVAMESSRPFYEETNLINKMKFLNPAFLNRKESISLTHNHENNGKSERNISIVYAGYLYMPDRNPEYIIQALSIVQDFSIKLTFVGKSEVNSILEKEKETFNGELVNLGQVQHEELNNILNDADVFLHLGVSNGNAISGKIFEYMSYGKPIIAIYFDENEATLPYLEKYPLACCINKNDHSIFEAANIINGFLHDINGRSVDYSLVLDLFYNSTPQAFIDVLDGLSEEKRCELD